MKILHTVPELRYIHDLCSFKRGTRWCLQKLKTTKQRHKALNNEMFNYWLKTFIFSLLCHFRVDDFIKFENNCLRAVLNSLMWVGSVLQRIQGRLVDNLTLTNKTPHINPFNNICKLVVSIRCYTCTFLNRGLYIWRQYI